MLALRPDPDGKTPVLEHLDKPYVTTRTALVKIMAAPITPSDLLNSHGAFRNPGDEVRTLGRDYAGVVEQGPQEWIGKEVYGSSGSALSFQTDGTHADYCLISVNCLAEKPTNLSFIQAASVGLSFTTAALALRRAGVQPGESVLVLGALGNVGSAMCQLAALKGCRIIKAGRSGEVDVNLVSDPQMEAAKKVTGGKGPDVVVDTTGQPAIMRAALECLGRGGRLSFISAPRKGSTEITLDLLAMYHTQKSMIGCNSIEEEQEQVASELRDMKRGFENGSLTAPGDSAFETVPLREVPAAYEAMSNGARKRFVITA